MKENICVTKRSRNKWYTGEVGMYEIIAQGLRTRPFQR